jgi:hypothetical protein
LVVVSHHQFGVAEKLAGQVCAVLGTKKACRRSAGVPVHTDINSHFGSPSIQEKWTGGFALPGYPRIAFSMVSSNSLLFMFLRQLPYLWQFVNNII